MVREQIRKGEYWDFGFKYWGNIHVCEMSEVPEGTSSHYVIKAIHPQVREVLENVAKNWRDYVNNMGAPNLGGKSIIIAAYENEKRKLMDT